MVNVGDLECTMALTSILTINPDDADRIYAWARYIFWAEVECQQYDAYEHAEDEPTLGRGTVLMLQFYAALWAAIEGWKECQLSDETIDELLTDPAFQHNIQLLRRFRNGVYHYQADLINDRVLEFLHEGAHSVIWAYLLHDEFKRVVWEILHPPGLSLKVQDDLAEAICGIIGWLPTDIPEAAPHRAAKQYREVAEMILKSGGRDTPQFRDLLAAVNRFRFTASEAKLGWVQQKRAMIDALKKTKLIPQTGPIKQKDAPDGRQREGRGGG